MSASELYVGETLRGHDGVVTVTALTRDPGVHRVYNMTVEADHVYYVGGLSTLVHNNGCGPKGFSNPEFGAEVHQNFEQALLEQTNTQAGDWNMRTAPGLTGVDAEYIGPSSRHPGFDYAELKPSSQNGYEVFQKQLDSWNLPPGRTRLWFYNENGIIGFTGSTF